jgi:pimeloyl-ACP methyl ester carboxylesterase
VADCLRTMNRAGLVNAVVSISVRRPDLTPRLSQISCPTLFVTGSDPIGWTPEQAQAAGRLIADGATEVIPNVAYLIPLEAPDRTVQPAIFGHSLFNAAFRQRPARRANGRPAWLARGHGSILDVASSHPA